MKSIVSALAALIVLCAFPTVLRAQCYTHEQGIADLQRDAINSGDSVAVAYLSQEQSKSFVSTAKPWGAFPGVEPDRVALLIIGSVPGVVSALGYNTDGCFMAGVVIMPAPVFMAIATNAFGDELPTFERIVTGQGA